MRKLFAIGVLVGGLLAGAGWGQAQAAPLTPQAGLGDPLTLAASGVLLPFITAGGSTSLIEVASPVGPNSSGGHGIHLIFFNNVCARTGVSVDIPETTNDIAFFDVGASVLSGTNGLATVAFSNDFLTLTPLPSPIHSRVYVFSPVDGRSRVLEPIILDTAELGSAQGIPFHLWSPLRTAATFFAPFETATVKTTLSLICPRTSIQGDFGAAFGQGVGPYSSNGFPVIDPALFPSSGGAGAPKLQGVVYDTNENFVNDIHFSCDCISPDVSVTVLGPGAYDGLLSKNGTYTEIQVENASATAVGSFTGYRSVFTVGSPLNNFFGRLSNGSSGSIFTGTLTNTR